MGDAGAALMVVALSVISSMFWWWVCWRIAKLKPVAESNLARRFFKGFGLLIGIGTPVMAIVAAGMIFY